MALALFNPCQPCCQDEGCPCSGFPSPAKIYIYNHLMPASGMAIGDLSFNDDVWSGTVDLDISGCTGGELYVSVTCSGPDILTDEGNYILTTTGCFTHSDSPGRHPPCDSDCNTNVYFNTISTSGCCGVRSLDVLIKESGYQFCTSALFGANSLFYSSACGGLTQDIPNTLYFNVSNGVSSSIELTYNSALERWEGHGTINSPSAGSREFDVEAYWLLDFTNGDTAMQAKITPNPATFTCTKYIDTVPVTDCSPFTTDLGLFTGCGIIMSWNLTE